MNFSRNIAVFCRKLRERVLRQVLGGMDILHHAVQVQHRTGLIGANDLVQHLIVTIQETAVATGTVVHVVPPLKVFLSISREKMQKL